MILKIAVFTVGASVMILELTGARVLAPYLGTSIIVWTSLLGMIMASLSAGYYLGGKVADTKADYETLAFIIFFAGIFVSIVAMSKSTVLLFVQMQIADIRLATLVGTFILFAPANILLGAISPYAVKLHFNDSRHIGSTVGNLYAISTVGSIFGAYLTGFFLISYFGNTNILFSLAALLVFLSLVVYPAQKLISRGVVILIISAAPLLNSSLKNQFASQGLLDVDTQYNRVWIWGSIDPVSRRPLRTLSTGAHYVQSAMFLDGDDLAVEYTDFFKVAEHFNKDIKKALMIGGGAYSFPKDFLSRNKNAEMDVVEIDPRLTELAEKYFNLAKSPRLKVFHQDGRIFLDRTDNKYDAIFIDAFASSIPFHLTTREFIASAFDRLNDNGVVAMNIIASVDGNKGKFLRAEYVTYKLFSDFVYIFPVQKPESSSEVQNIILIAVKSDGNFYFQDGLNKKFKKYLDNLWREEIKVDVPFLTDDFAPVDQYLANVF